VGAIAGCAIGHHMAVQEKREREQQKLREVDDNRFGPNPLFQGADGR
jgi:hypothetical protein